MMKRVLGVKNDKGKEKQLPPSVHGASNRSTERGETVDEKIRKLDALLGRYREQIKRTRPGPAQEVIKARAMRVLKQKRTYEGQRGMLCNQTSSLDQVAFAAEEFKDAQQNSSKGQGSRRFSRGFMHSLIGTCCLPLDKY